MSQLNSLLESSANNWKSVQSDAARLADKWEKTGLLEGMGSEVNKNNMSMILENQAKQLVVEQSQNTIAGGGGGTFTAGQGAQWAGVALPLVRKVFGQIAAKEFVSVQPMNLPSGLVFFLDFQYGQAKSMNFGGPGDAYSSPASMYGNTNPGAGVDPSDGLYGAGRFGYSINQFSSSRTGAQVVASNTSWESVHYDDVLSASIAANEYQTISVDVSGLRVDTKGVRAFALSSGSVFDDASAALVLPQYTEYDAGQDRVYFVFSGSAGDAGVPASTDDVILKYNVQPTDDARGDFEDAAGAGRPNAESTAADALAIPSIDVKMKSEAIVAKTRKLKAQWTPEFAQD